MRKRKRLHDSYVGNRQTRYYPWSIPFSRRSRKDTDEITALLNRNTNKRFGRSDIVFSTTSNQFINKRSYHMYSYYKWLDRLWYKRAKSKATYETKSLNL